MVSLTQKFPFNRFDSLSRVNCCSSYKINIKNTDRNWWNKWLDLTNNAFINSYFQQHSCNTSRNVFFSWHIKNYMCAHIRCLPSSIFGMNESRRCWTWTYCEFLSDFFLIHRAFHDDHATIFFIFIDGIIRSTFMKMRVIAVNNIILRVCF